MDLLNKHYARVLTLKEWLCCSLEVEGHTNSGLLDNGTEHESYKRLLTSVYVCEETDKCKLPSFTLSNYHQQKEIVLTAIERILGKKGYGKNVLTYGFCLMSQDPFALSCGVNVESRYPNSSVNRLFYPEWETLLSRTGDAVMMYLLEHTSVFHQVTPTCMVQISGTPLNNLPERIAQDNKGLKTNNRAKQTKQNTNTDEIKSVIRDSKVDDLRTDCETDNVDNLIDPKENNFRKVSFCSFVQLEHAEQAYRNNINKQRDGEAIGEVIENTERVKVTTDMYSSNKRKSGMNKRTYNKCKRYKQSKNTMEKSSRIKRMKKYEDISENRYQELKKRSAAYAIGRKEGDPNIPSENGCWEVFQVEHGVSSTKCNPDNTNQRKRKFCETNMYTENSGEMEADNEAGETKRRRLQSQNEFESDCNVIGGSECKTVDVIGHDENKECEMNIGERDQVHKQLDKKVHGGQTAKKKRKRKHHSKIAKEIKADRQFCPFEFQLPLPRNNILLARNPREAFPKSVLLSRLDASPGDIVLLYRQIFCETKVLSDTENIRVNSPCINDVQVVLGISEDKETEEGLKGQVQDHSNSYLLKHQSFWNDSGGGNTFLTDLSGAYVPSEISHIGLKTLCRFPSSDRRNGKPEVSAVTAGLNHHNNENKTLRKEVHKTKFCQKSDTENTDITEILGKRSSSVAAVGKQNNTGKEKSSCRTCIIQKSSKEELLAKRKYEIISSRNKSWLNKFSKEEFESLGKQAKEGMELNKVDNNSSSNSMCFSKSAHETTKNSSLVDAIMTTHDVGAVIFDEKDGKESPKVRTSPAQQLYSSQIGSSPAQGLYSGEIRTSPAQGQNSSHIRTSPAQHLYSSQIDSNPAQEQDSNEIRTSPAQVLYSCQVRTSPAQDHGSSQQADLHDLHTSQHSVQCVSRQTVNIPAFTDVTFLLKQVIENHRSCPFKALVNYHCPLVCKKAESRLIHRNRRDVQKRQSGLAMSQLLGNHHHHRKVYLFLRACIVKVVPLELLGKKHNFNILLKSKFARLVIALCLSS